MKNNNKKTTIQDTSTAIEVEQSNNNINEIISDNYKNINDYDEDFLETMTLQQIYDTAFEPKKQIIKNFLYSGVYLFVGAPKIGKSFFMAQMGYCVGTGIDLWDYKVKQGKVLYLALEDDYARIQQRMYTMYSTDVDNSDEEKEQGNIKDFHFSTKAKSMADGLIRQLKNFMGRHKGTTLIIIDTLQKVRGVSGDNYSYANDYEVITKIKEFADENNICIIVVHHTRKQLSDDSFDAISGTNGLLGAADGAFMMIKSKRDENLATLEVVGRDIPDQKLNLRKDIKTCLWQLESAQNDLYSKPPDELLEKIAKLVNEDKREWNGTMTELLEELEIEDIKPGAFSRKLNLKLNELFNDYNIEVKRKVTGKARLVSLVLMD